MLLRNVSARPLLWADTVLLPDRETEIAPEAAEAPGIRALVDQGFAALILEAGDGEIPKPRRTRAKAREG